MADPSPPAIRNGGLPEVEYVEIHNNTSQSVDLFGWKIADKQSTAVISIHYLLKADSFVVLASTSGAAALSKFGSALGITGFPSLDNDNDQLVLSSKEGLVVHAVEYSSDWFQNSVKETGGWSLEMMDVHAPCIAGGNWAACAFPAGGSPGKKNSMAGILKDTAPPSVIRAYAPDERHITVLFEQTVEEKEAMLPVNYVVENTGMNITSATMSGPLYNAVTLTTSQPLIPDSVYWLTVVGVSDCRGQRITNRSRIKTGLFGNPDSARVVVNEILFNPLSPGVDYVELLNTGKTIVNLQQVSIGNRSASGTAGSPKQVSEQAALLFPGEYLVVTEDPAAVKKQFITRDETAFYRLTSMPSFPDDRGTVLVFNNRGRILDELAYDEKWHFALISEPAGVALERISALKPTQDKNNWHSAAASTGFGTPGYANSQASNDVNADNDISINPKIFSPDNDGRDDYLTVGYRFDEPGFVANMTVFNTRGNAIKTLAQNMLCGRQGYIRWDGLNNKGQKTSLGAYILVAEIFSVAGKTKKYKIPLVVAATF